MTQPVNTTTDPSSHDAFNKNGQGVSDAAARVGAPAPSTGLDDLDSVLGKHTDKTKDELDDSKKTLDKSAKGINDLTDTDKDSAKKFKGPDGPRVNNAGFSPPPSASPSPAPMAAPAPAPAAAPMSAPAPSSSPIPASMRPISPQALATLLSNAGVTPESASEAMNSGGHVGTGAKQRVDPKLSRTGRGAMSPAELRVAIDKAADAAGIPNDKMVRAKWHALYRFLIEHESGNQPDRIQEVKDVNMSGAQAADGAPANAARGLCMMVPGTFGGHHVAGTSDNIYDPVANIAASMSYVMTRYHVEPNAGSNFDTFEARRHANGYTGY
ncbi:transglycosylase (plasmid) [Mycolicibacterium sp. TY66]|uniref:Uncharacterized protein n=1 Tax=Mycobacteroides chelonae TaxID=1774 RepID=A0A1S1LQT3_MYCCH|nr:MULTISPECIES: transglycosylase SLT domain-containing protein [Mycobacteriaceae]OHU57081.1 hypothetical protein BKG82_12890 [Mycobacteroides chelonae]BCI84655.1 transglycosylase [Mycolicibacterium sp. TY66]BCJ84885.1 transglycosylase [Mycolicibacterium sp. TY81]